MGKASEAWLRRPVSALVIGPPNAGVDWVRRHLARHPHLSVPGTPSGFWSHLYGVDPLVRPAHWSRAFIGLEGKARGECDESLAALPHRKVGALAAANPRIRVAFIARDPASRSWDALRAFHARHGGELNLGGGLGWIDEALARPDDFRGRPLDLMRDGDYAGTLRRWASYLNADQLGLYRYDDLVAVPGLFLGEVLAKTFRVDPGLVDEDDGPAPGFVESTLPETPPPAIRARLEAMHRRQVREVEELLGVDLSSHWGS